MATVKKNLRFLKQNKRKMATKKKKINIACSFFFTNCAYIYKNLSSRNNPGPKENTKP